MKRISIVIVILILVLLAAVVFAACDQTPAQPSEGSGRDVSGTASGSPRTDESGNASAQTSEGPGEPDAQESGEQNPGSETSQAGHRKTQRNGLVFSSEEQADPIMEYGLAEFRAYTRADANGKYAGDIYAQYYNNYLLPYYDMLSDNQILIDPDSVKSNWFPNGSEDTKLRIASSYGNLYRKIAQDMLPYMLPDPDELLLSIAEYCGSDASVLDRRLDVEKMKSDYQKWLDNWDARHFYELLRTDWGTYWEDNLWAGDKYVFNDVTVGFSSPKYNRQKCVNLRVFGDEYDGDKQEAFLPYSRASALLTEIQDTRAKGDEFYYQDFTVSIRNNSDVAYAKMWEIFKMFFPHATESQQREWFNAMRSGETKHVFVNSYDYGFRFNKYLNYLEERDYSFVMPEFGKYDGAEPRFGTEYRVDINDWYTNGTCDSYINFGLRSGNGGDGQIVLTMTIEIGGKDLRPTNLYRDSDVFYSNNYQCSYGVFYAILAPFYYNEAVKSGCFTPYVYSGELTQNPIPLTPDYQKEKEEKTLKDVIGTGTGESVQHEDSKWLQNGFGAEYHDFPERRDQMTPPDFEKLGYKQNSDGNWVRQLPTTDIETSHTLVYDSEGVLIGGQRSYRDGTSRTYTYKTDVHNNPVASIDRYYNSANEMTDQAICRYDRQGNATRRDFYESSLRSGEVNYYRTQSIVLDADGEVADRTFYKDNKKASEYTVMTYENLQGSVGNPVTEYQKVVRHITYDSDGSVKNVEEEIVVTTKEKEEATHAVQNYLEKITGVKRDY